MSLSGAAVAAKMHVTVSNVSPPGPPLSPRRMRTLQRRRRSLVVAGAVAVAIIVALVAASMGTSHGVGGGATSTSTTAAAAGGQSAATGSTTALAASGHKKRTAGGLPAAESGVLPWQLSEPTSREVAVPGTAAGSVVVVGGLTAGSATTANAVSVAVPAGTSTPAGTLATPAHDAAGVVLGGHVLVFGGGVQTTVDTVQSLPLAAAGAAPTQGTTVGRLPQPRSDAVAVTIGRSAYVVGGYDGTRADPQVLSTTNGSSFHVVGNLPVPVRYPAAAAVGRDIYVFGGQKVGGQGAAVKTIQRIDTSTGKVTVVGRLPQALLGASAVVLNGVIYVAGGSGGGSGAADSGIIYAFDVKHDRALVAGHLIAPVSNAAVAAVGGTAWLMGGETAGTPTATVQMLKPNVKFGLAGKPGAGSPYYGQKLLIADRGNDRLLVLNDTGATVWTYPTPSMPPPPGPKGFYFPDDAFFIKHGTAIISNQEENETIVILGYPSGKILWTYGHPAQIGSAPGYLHEPDDAYYLKDGNVSVADAQNCRVLLINPAGTILNQIGTTGSCVHNPPTELGGPNGDTPLANGNFLISETSGSYISEYTPTGKLVWTTHLDIGYPSDPQQLGPNLYLCADYKDPGGIIEFNRSGKILYEYRVTSGIGRLNQPSLVELLPSGAFMVNDDYRDRMIAIDPTTQATIWDYGVPDSPGTAPGYLNTPDGFDVLNPNGSTPTHPQTG